MQYQVEYTISEYGATITLDSVWPKSDYVEQLFYNGYLFHTVNLDNDGKYRITFELAEDGYISIKGIEEYLGWVDIERY